MKVKILNMACGHCRLKIESELKSAGFNKIEFDMLHDIVDVEGTGLKKQDAFKAIEKAGYTVDESYRSVDSEINLEISTIDTDDEEAIRDLLQNEGIDDLVFDRDKKLLIINNTDKDIEEIKDLIEMLGHEVKIVE